ncbi:hypothetical protein F9622_21635 [Escherichia coli]|nr:hypothetical protein [Escherichia coli]
MGSKSIVTPVIATPILRMSGLARHLLSSVFCLLSSVFCLLSSVFCLLSSVFWILF